MEHNTNHATEPDKEEKEVTIIVTPSDGHSSKAHPAQHDADFLERLTTADREGFLELLRTATPAQALTAVHHMGLRELYELPREIIEAWPGDPLTPGTARYARRERLLAWRTKPTWRMKNVAAAANVRYDAASRWRTNYHNGLTDTTKCLPKEDDAAGDVKKPGEKDHPGGVPLWYPATILSWLYTTQRVTDDLYPHARSRGGRIPPGRPPAQRRPPE